MRRREFIAFAGLGTAAVHMALLPAARAQQVGPLIGFVHSLSSSYIENFAPAFRDGLAETGYVDGRNVSVAYRAADGRYDLLADLVTDLIKQKAAVIVAAGGPSLQRLRKLPHLPFRSCSSAPPIQSRRA